MTISPIQKFFACLHYEWAMRTGDYPRALIIMKEMTMADFTAMDAAIARIQAKETADAAALADTQSKLAAAEADAANLQSQIDNRTAQLDAIAPATTA